MTLKLVKSEPNKITKGLKDAIAFTKGNATRGTSDDYEIVGNRVYKVQEINPRNQAEVMRQLENRQKL